MQKPIQNKKPMQQPQYKRESYTPISNLQTNERGYEFTAEKVPVKNSNYYTPTMKLNDRMNQKIQIVPRIMDPHFSISETAFPVNEQPVENLGGMRFQEHKRVRHGMLLQPTENEKPVYIEKPNRLFLQGVEPHTYSITNDRTPINASVGISYTPQIPPLSKKTIIGDDGNVYPLYSRIDPELVRDDVTEERKAEMPKRNKWSENLPSSNPLNETNVYDPRFTGYGDSARSYYDTNLGQIRYYYTDIDPYRNPNFVIRNKVDHVDMIDPMGKVSSTYPRTASLEDVKDTVHDDWLAKSTEFREDIMEKLMRKNNAENWQIRHAPHSRGSRLSTFTSSY
jgi:hypothetical protein